MMESTFPGRTSFSRGEAVSMNRFLPIVAVGAVLHASPARAAQGFAVGARAGTLGLGPEVAVLVSDAVTLRAAAGVQGFSANVTSVSGLAPGRRGILSVPRSVYTFGADFAVLNLRIGAGMMYKKDDPSYAIRLDEGATIDIGDGEYAESEVSVLTTSLRAESWAPYAILGLGQHSSDGFGLFVDLGVAFLDRSALHMSASGDSAVINSPAFGADLRAEEASVTEDAGDLLGFWPILSVGVRFGLGSRRRDRLDS